MRIFRWWMAMSVVLACGGWIAAQGVPPPRFEDFAVAGIYRGRPAPVRLNSAEARSFRTRLRVGARKGPNFAGHYTVVGWGCGSNCETLMIVDARSGEAFPIPGDERGADFHINSRLLVLDPPLAPDATAYENDVTYTLPVRYYVWQGKTLRLLRSDACRVVEHHQVCGEHR